MAFVSFAARKNQNFSLEGGIFSIAVSFFHLMAIMHGKRWGEVFIFVKTVKTGRREGKGRVETLKILFNLLK